MKVHVLFNPDQQVPVLGKITAPNVNDIEAGRDDVVIEPGATYVFDKGYCDYNWWYRIDQEQAFFVTRFKSNAAVTTVGSRPIEPCDEVVILADEVVSFKNRKPGGKRTNHYHGTPLRRVVIDRPDKGTPLVLATNDLESSAEHIAALYKRRWAIELYFKGIKQNLKIKRFYGTSQNSVETQIYTALITYLLIHLQASRQGLKSCMRDLVITVRNGLFQRPETEYEMARRRQREREREAEQLEREHMQPELALL